MPDLTLPGGSVLKDDPNYPVVGSLINTTIQDEGITLSPRTGINFIGAGVSVVDDPANSRSNVTINAGTGALRSNSVSGPIIDLRDFGLPMDNATDCSAAVASARAFYGPKGGGILTFPVGVFKFSNSILDLTDSVWSVQGAGQFATTLHCPVDANNAFIVLTRGGVVIRDLSIVGPRSSDVNNVGTAPLRRGVVLRDRNLMSNVRVEAFGMNVVIEGNHQVLRDVQLTNGKYNLVWGQGLAGYATYQAASFSHGNHRLDAVDLTGAGEASILIAGDAVIDSSTLVQVHTGFCPIGIQLAPKTAQEGAISNSTFIDCSFESVGSCYINDLGWNTSGRRLVAYTKFINQLTGGHEPSYAPGGVGGIEMLKIGRVNDLQLIGRVGDSFNTSFGSVGWGNPSTACGYRFEECNNFIHTQADVLWGGAAGQNKPILRIEGGAGGVGGSANNYITVFGRYLVALMRANVDLTNEYLVCATATGDPWSAGGGVKHADGTAPAIGRVAGAGPLTGGQWVPIVVQGAFNSPPSVAGVAQCDTLVVDTANPGRVKTHSAFGQQIVGTALASAGPGAGAGCALTFPLRPTNIP